MKKRHLLRGTGERASLRDTLHMTRLLFVAQMRPLKGNVAAALVCLGLALLPPLYAWFNIAANWSPYDRTSDLKVAVTSLDKGAELEGVKLNVGDEIIKALKANDAIGWQFVSYKEGQKGVDSGDYYAALVIPKDFTQTLTGFLNGDIQEAKINYYVNEKENAISTKIMGTGMDTVSSEINETFVETVTKIVLDSLKVADNEFADYKPSFMRMLDTMDLAADNMDLFVKNMDELENSLDQLNNLTDSAQNTLPKVSTALKDASKLTADAQDTLAQSRSTVSDVESLLGQNVRALSSYSDTLSAQAEELANTSAEDSAAAVDRLQASIDSLDQLESHVTNLADNFNRFNQLLPKPLNTLSDFANRLQSLASAVGRGSDQLADLRDALADGSADVGDALTQAADLMTSLSGSVTDTYNAYNNGVSKALSKSADSLDTTLEDSGNLLDSLDALVPKTDAALAAVQDMGPTSSDTIEKYKSMIEDTQALLEKQTGDLRDLSEDDKFDEMLAFVQRDAEKQSAFLSHPVDMQTHRLYPVANYGSGMSPFYTTLSIWVGVLLMMSMISTINEKGLEAYPKARVTPMYLSRLMLYQMISVVQCLVISLGDLLILQVDCRHPVLFVLLCILIGQIFSILVFSLVFTFSAIGKALSIVILVLQIAASGGTFPIEMTPAFFQWIHPLLPFTYCIGAMREICFGVYWPALVHDFIVMALIPIISVALVIIFGPILRRFVLFFERSMKKSGLM